MRQHGGLGRCGRVGCRSPSGLSNTEHSRTADLTSSDRLSACIALRALRQVSMLLALSTSRSFTSALLMVSKDVKGSLFVNNMSTTSCTAQNERAKYNPAYVEQ